MKTESCDLCKEECSCKTTTRQRAPITMVRQAPPSSKMQRAIILEAIKKRKQAEKKDE